MSAHEPESSDIQRRTPMHHFDDSSEHLLHDVIEFVRHRLALHPVPLDGSSSADELDAAAPSLITESGNDASVVLQQYSNVLSRAVLSSDSPRFLSFIPAAPTKAACLFDMVVSASSLNGTSWMEAAGAVHAENQVLSALAKEAGLPDTSGGCFVSGGSAGNLSALAVARDVGRHRRGDRARMRFVLSEQAHSSISNTANILDCDLLTVPAPDGRLTGEAVARAVAADPNPETICAVIATAGTTNAGIVDDLNGIADVAATHGWWFHIDGAYGAAALLAPSVRDKFHGIERCDSMIVDPHKWLFAPFDCAALIYREPHLAKGVHTQDASYLDAIHVHDQEWNPTDYAYHLSRRARGLAIWFSMAVHGLGAYRDAIEETLRIARWTAARIDELEHLELMMQPDLSVVMFRRNGWDAADYQQWSDQLLASGTGFVLPSKWNGEPVLRFAIINPDTNEAIIEEILNTME